MRARGECGWHLCPPDRTLVGSRSTHHLYDPPLSGDRHGARICRSRERVAGGSGRPSGFRLHTYGAKVRSHRHLRKSQPEYRCGWMAPPGKPRASCSIPTTTASCRGSKCHGENADSCAPRYQTRSARRHHPPDGNMLLGPAPGLQNYWCCNGCQIGVGWGPGAGKYLAQWMVHGAAENFSA